MNCLLCRSEVWCEEDGKRKIKFWGEEKCISGETMISQQDRNPGWNQKGRNERDSILVGD